MAEPVFDAPIPGSSLTKEVGSRPWKNPPQHSTLEEAVNFYVDRMSTEEFTDKLVTTLEMGVPVTSVVNVMQLHGVMEGRHTLDVSILLIPILMEMVALVADSVGIEYDMGLEDEVRLEDHSNDMVEVAKRKLLAKQDFEVNEESEMPEEVEINEESTENEEEVIRGLMARGV
jgi:hypothetical protein|tara:strand:+ start:1552 stop:2070 length:519 start_codon:yes stop_codon:yes gene_type:complete